MAAPVKEGPLPRCRERGQDRETRWTKREDDGTARYWTTTVPCIIAPWGMQKYGKVPACVNVWLNVMPVAAPESQIPSGVHPAVQVPDVVEWKSDPAQTHWIVSPTLIVDVPVPLTRSTNVIELPGPTSTMRVAPAGGVGVGVLPTGGVGVAVAPVGGVGVAVAPVGGVGVAVAFGPTIVSSSLQAPAARSAMATAASNPSLSFMKHLHD
jgi:hypothetical protein